MRVLLVSGVYPPAIGGPAAQTQQIARALLARGLDVRVATLPAGGPIPSDDDVQVTVLDPGPRPGLHRKLLRVPRLVRQMDALVEGFRPDVIHMQTASGPIALAAAWVVRRRRIPSILKYAADVTGEAAYRSGRAEDAALPGLVRARMGLLRLTQRFLFGSSDLIWATTPRYAERLTGALGVPPERILRLDNFVDLAPFEAVAETRTPPTDGAPVRLLTVARLNVLKGVDVCIAALARLGDLPVRLRIVGSGSPEYAGELHRAVAEAGLTDRVDFAGPVSNGDLDREYREADVFVLGSRSEAFGIVLLEAMAAGLPIVATRVGGVPYVVEEGPGAPAARLVPPADPDALAEALRSLIEHPEERAAFTAAGRLRARDFSFEPSLDRLVAAYRRISAPATSGGVRTGLVGT